MTNLENCIKQEANATPGHRKRLDSIVQNMGVELPCFDSAAHEKMRAHFPLSSNLQSAVDHYANHTTFETSSVRK